MSHLDWAISMGIFMVAILTIFILLKPATPPLYPEESVMPIVETNFINDVYWTVKEVPLIIKNCAAVDGNPWEVTVNTNWGTENTTTYNSDDGEGIYYLTFYSLDSEDIILSLSRTNCGTETILGAQESIRGINEEKLKSLGKYRSIKERWGYPEARDFLILIKENGEFKKLNVDMPDPYQNANVFVKQIKDFYVDRGGGLAKVEIILEVW